jgi:aspartate/methionine/tyrosine aminotransferase
VSGDLSAVAMMREAFDRRRLTIHRMLNEIDGIDCLLPEGAFYAFPSVSGLYGRTFRGRTCSTSAELATLAIEEAKVAVVPGEAFGSPGYFRMSYALGDDDLVEGVSRLAGLFGTG